MNDQFSAIEDIALSHGYEVLEKITSNKNRTLILKDINGYLYKSAHKNFLAVINRNIQMLRFSPNNIFATENIKRWIDLNSKPFSLLSGDIIGNDVANLKFECSICKNIWYTCWMSIYTIGTGCPYCAGKIATETRNIKASRPDLIEEWNWNKNIGINPEEILPRSDKKVWWICKEGHEWEASVSNRNNNTIEKQSSCPICCKSRGETKIYNFLNNNQIEFEAQKTFKDCINIKKLPFDFYLPKENLCIEYQGEHHYKPVAYSKKTEKYILDYEHRLELDKIKELFCEKNDIGLLKIPYWDFNNIHKILSSIMED